MADQDKTISENTSAALEAFVRDNANFESSTAIDKAAKLIAASENLDAAALVPLRQKIFNFDAALLWGFFLSQTVKRLADETEEEVPEFNLLTYMDIVAQVYDIAAERLFDAVVEDSDDEESDEEYSEEETSEEEAAAEAAGEAEGEAADQEVTSATAALE